MSPIQAHTRLRRNRDVIAHLLHDDLVMADLESGHYFGLAGTGRRTWELLAEPTDVQAIVRRLTAEYEIDPETCLSHVLAFLEQLRGQGLLIVE